MGTNENNTDTTTRRVAETTAGISRGWCYTPLRQGKRPYLPKWPTRIDDSDAMIDYAARGNVGLITGARSGIDVIDLDGDATSRLGEFPATVTVITGGGGRHLYYLHSGDGGAVKNWVGALGEHIDIRTTGGQVVAVGSIHATTGQVYRWAPGLSPDEIDFAPLPVDLIRQMLNAEPDPEQATEPPPETTHAPVGPPRQHTQDRRSRWLTAILDGEKSAILNAPSGQRNAALNRAAYNLGQIVGAGEMSEQEAEQALHDACAHAPDWAQAGISATIRSGMAGGKRNPRTQSRLPHADTSSHCDIVPDYGEEVIEIPFGYEPRRSAQTPAPKPAPIAAARSVTAGYSLDPMGPAVTGESIRMGDKDPATGRVVLSPKKTLPTAQAFTRDFYTHTERPTIVFCGGVFYTWRDDQNCWREIEPKILERRIGRWLHEALRFHRTPQGESRPVPFESNPQTVAAAVATLKAEASIAQDTPLPSWLAGDDPDSPQSPPRPLGECIAFRSQTLHIPSEELYEPTPCHWIHNALEFDYDAMAPAPSKWLSFLGDILSDDQDQISLMQEWFGYCLTADTRQHKIFLFQGPPRCGKGTCARILERLIGVSNVCNPSVQELADTFGLQPFVGKSLAIFGDAKWTSREAGMAVEKLLRVSGGDGVNVRRMYLPSLTNVKLGTRIMLLANDRPEFLDASGAMANRFLIIESKVSYLGREDLKLEDNLVAELPGILLWAIEGWRRLRSQGRFTRPALMADRLAEMTEAASPVMQFAEECCNLGPAEHVFVVDLWKAWQEWSKRQGQDSGSLTQFGRCLRSAVPGLERRRNNSSSGRYYQGISLKESLI